MKIKDLQPRIIAVLGGRYHPFHHGHAEVFRELANKFGINNTYITTGGKVDPLKSPFNFTEKSVMMQAAGIPVANIVEEVVPYAPVNLPQKLQLDPNSDVMVFGVGKKDMQEDPRFSFQPLKNGSPSYFQQYTGKDLMPYSDQKNADGTRSGHGYIYPVADVQFTINGQQINSASAIREMYRNADDDSRIAILQELYPQGGRLIARIKRIFDAKLG